MNKISDTSNNSDYDLSIQAPLWLPGAVLQRGVPLPLWGSAPIQSSVSVEVAGQQVTAVASANGKWQLMIGPLPVGGPHILKVECSDGSILEVQDLLVGDVWLCSGQSNMDFRLRNAEDAAMALAEADNNNLRLAIIPVCVAETPLGEVGPTHWQASNSESAAGFSAVAHYFGQHLQRHLDIPIGLVLSARGATPAEAWMSQEELNSNPDFAPIMERRQHSLELYPDDAGIVKAEFTAWDKEADQAEREGRPMPGPQPKLVGPGHAWTPAGLYNAMIAPLHEFPICGVIWYQGAAAPERAFQYRSLFRALIRDWRQARGSDFPFLFVQEAAFGPRLDHPNENTWAELREAQHMALAEPNTAMAVALDCGDATDIHPPRKRPLGDRLALAARAMVYHETVAGFSPFYRSMSIEGNTIRVQFNNTDGGLTTLDGQPIVGFAVSAGCDDFSRGNRCFKWAQARIEGDEVVVWSDEVPNPVAVRYAWAQNPAANLCNGAGLPAAPFRSDEFPGITVDVR